MALAPLATVADLEARGLTVDPSESGPVAVFLDVASSIVRDAAGSPISETTSTVDNLEGELGQRLRLPGPPIRSVSAVSIDGTAVTDWKLVSGALFRAAGWRPGCDPATVEVTYIHGLPVVPADIVDLVCRMAAQCLVKLRESPESLSSKPVVQERIGDYSVTYAYELAYSEMEIPKYLRAQLAARFGTGGGQAVRMR